MRRVDIAPTFEAFRARARECLQAGLAPQEVAFSGTTTRQGEAQGNLFAPTSPASPAPGRLRVPGAFLRDAAEVACHRNAGRWDLLYRLLWRLTHGEPALLEVASDGDTQAFERALRAVRRDVHKCHAFVRFRQVAERWVAWHRPDHFILPLAAPHFVRRFAAHRWSILSADQSVHWDGNRLTEGPGVPQPPGGTEDDVAALWRLYYGATFNPARLKVRAMRAEMPRRYWKTMPETQAIDRLVGEASGRLQAYADSLPPSATALVPAPPAARAQLAQAARACAVCAWCSHATQTVFGTGPSQAPLMLVGEQPGDEEDRRGTPFVGPAGRLLHEALAAAGLDPAEVYLTNAVKHFKWEPRGKKRLHRRPSAADVAACRPWLVAEAQSLEPTVLVCLGATAAQAVLGRAVKLEEARGHWQRSALCQRTLICGHPAAVLRAPAGQQAALRARLIAELAEAKHQLPPDRRAAEIAQAGAGPFTCP